MGIRELILATETFKKEENHKIATFENVEDFTKIDSYQYFCKEMNFYQTAVAKDFPPTAKYISVKFDRDNLLCWCAYSYNKKELKELYSSNIELLILNIERF